MADAKNLDELFQQRFLAADARGLAELYTEDAVLYDVGPEFEFRGRAAIRAHFEQVFAALTPATFDIQTTVQTEGDVAYVHGTGTVRARGADGGELPAMHLRIMDVRRRQADGRWLVVLYHLSAGAG